MRPRLARERMWRLRTADRLLLNERSRCVVVHRSERYAKELRFDHVFSHRTSQHKLYTTCQIPKQVKAVLRGDAMRASIIAYGQSGSGKTYSLYGDDECPAIIQHVARDLFKNIDYATSRGEESTTKYDVTLSFMQIVNDKLVDLFNPDGSSDLLHVREMKNEGGVYVDGLVELSVVGATHVMHLLRGGASKASQRAIKASFQSTTSHTIVTLNVAISTKNDAVRKSRIQFVDLAGADSFHSEETGSPAARKSSLSLFTLSQVVLALARSKSSASGFVPYRNSILTRILKDSLSGSNCLTLILVCISPLQTNLHETLNSLKFAALAKYHDSTGRNQTRFGQKYLPDVKLGYNPTSRIASGPLLDYETIPGQTNTTDSTTAPRSLEFPLPQPHADSSDPIPFVDDDQAMEPLVFAQAARSVGLDPGDYILYLADRSMKPEQFAVAARNSGMGLIQFARHTAAAGIHPMDFARHYGLLQSDFRTEDDTAETWAPYLWDSSMQELLDYASSLEQGIPTQDRIIRGVALSRVFSGADAAAFFIDALDGVESVDDALRVGRKLLLLGIIKGVGGDATNGFYATPTRLYRFCYEETIAERLKKENFFDDFPEAESVKKESAKSASCTVL